MRINIFRHLLERDIFSNRKEIPQELKSRQEWSWLGRKVKKEAIPDAALQLIIKGTQRWQYFFAKRVTEPYQQPFASAYRYFARLFCGPAFHQDYIYRWQGRDEDGWRHAFQPLTLSKIRKHILGQSILGTIGFRSTNHLTFDIDYHAKDDRRELFLARCKVFHEELPKFFGTAWFAMCKPQDISGIHFNVLMRTIPIARAQEKANHFLTMLDQKYPALATIESFTKIEVYPVAKGNKDGVGCRLPLSQGRVCITDRFLNEDPKTNCINLVAWIQNDDRQNIEAQPFMEFLIQNTPRHKAPPQKPAKTPKPRKTGNGMGSIGRLKGQCLRTLFDFWSGNVQPENDTIGKYAVVMARHIWKQGILDQEQCLDWLEEAFLALKHKTFSDRLCDDFEELMRVTAKMVEAVYKNNGYQASPEESAKKLEQVIAYCKRHGILIHDRQTWEHLPGKPQWLTDVVANDSFKFNYDQRQMLKQEVHPLLHTDNIAATYEAARRVVSLVKQYPYRELAWKLVPYLCGDLPIHWHKNKCCAFLSALVRIGFLYIRVEKLWRGSMKEFNRARAYGIGVALIEKSREKPTNHINSAFSSSVSIISHSDSKQENLKRRLKAELNRISAWKPFSDQRYGGMNRHPLSAIDDKTTDKALVRAPPSLASVYATS